MEDKSVFISSVTRRDLARRRPSRTLMRIESLLAFALIVAAVCAFIVVRFGL
jgi:hypothetical protein